MVKPEDIAREAAEKLRGWIDSQSIGKPSSALLAVMYAAARGTEAEANRIYGEAISSAVEARDREIRILEAANLTLRLRDQPKTLEDLPELLQQQVEAAVEAARAEERLRALRDAVKACDSVDLLGADECIGQINILINAEIFPRARGKEKA